MEISLRKESDLKKRLLQFHIKQHFHPVFLADLLSAKNYPSRQKALFRSLHGYNEKMLSCNNGTIIAIMVENLQMEFRPLQTAEQLEKIAGSKESNIIFKHNTTCPISKRVKRELEEGGDVLPNETPFYILDLRAHQDISDAIANTFHVEHESPQLLLVKDGKCVYNQSLYNISAEETAQALEENK